MTTPPLRQRKIDCYQPREEQLLFPCIACFLTYSKLKIGTLSGTEIHFIIFLITPSLSSAQSEQLGLIKGLNEITWSSYNVMTFKIYSKLSVFFLTRRYYNWMYC